MGYTKSKWHVNVWTTGRREVINENGLVICEVHRTHVDIEQRDNANLISASPDLYKACKSMLAGIEESIIDTIVGTEWEEEYLILKKVIDKVELDEEAPCQFCGEMNCYRSCTGGLDG